ncbi:inositol 1,4,5-triphosphate receptor associated 2 isoform X10 [Gouania willdenowi]|uniref:inositol 1,4,5-triphosphate receptor associated 2 isoform X10 n=1 Tax=Gouania willdenowi TaxID=441366 RepID=UPI00105548B4|nr:lymphoid-restricted membrane protein-like isoform X10 [Gouania willdenowi]
MDYCTPQPSRRHNPVDSICRKLQTIQWQGDREPNSPFRIPKLCTNSYDSPQSGIRRNLEAILKKGALYREEGEQRKEKGMEMPASATSHKSSLCPSTPPSIVSTPVCNSTTSANVTYTVTSTLGERRGADGRSDLSQTKTWQRYCSTPTCQPKDSPYFTFTKGLQSMEPKSEKMPSGKSRLSRTFTPSRSTLSYNLNFCSADGLISEWDLPYPALVVKSLSLEDGGSSLASDNRKENMAEISLICEENLLDTIFHACDTQRRGKVYVSHIVDYLRHTTSRSSGDSGLEDLCNMLDPEQKDVSIDLDTYHAVMREWIDDCRNNGEGPTDDVTQDPVKDGLAAKRSKLLNMTSGSLEAFGGEASRAEFETSELVYCVADLQMSNHKLQDEVKKLKQVVENMEESNQKLAEENEALRSQAKANQLLTQKEKMLKEEVEEMKASLTCTEEGRALASAHSKNMERENQSLIAKIASLQEENFKVTLETEELQRKLAELCDINADLQLQIHSFDAVISEKEAVILEKSRHIDELKAAVEEYSSITELLRLHKTKLENQLQMILPDLAGASLPLSLAYKLNQSSLGSLQAELAQAQSPLEVPNGIDHFPSTMGFVSPLDETLDKEVLLMLQGPTPEQMSLDFKSLLNKMQKDFNEETSSVLLTIQSLLEDHTQLEAIPNIQTVQAELDTKRADWVLSLDQLAQYTDSLEKELVKMASNMRRSRTEILHLSIRVQEHENQKRQLCEEIEQLKTPQDSREAFSQTPEPGPGEDLDWDEEFALQDFLKNEQAQRNCHVQDVLRDGATLRTTDKVTDRGEEDDGDERWMVVDTTGEEELRDASTPLSPVSVESLLLQDVAERKYSESRTVAEHKRNSSSLKETAVPSNTHAQAAGIRQQEADALPDKSHTENNTATEVCEGLESAPCDTSPSKSTKRDQTITPTNTVPAAVSMVCPNGTADGPDDTNTQSESNQRTGDDREEREGKDNLTAGDMIQIKDQSAHSSAAEEGLRLLPVVVEEEECVQESAAETSTAVVSKGTEQLTCSMATNGSSAQSDPSVTQSSQPESGMTSNPSHIDVLARSIEATEVHKDQDDKNETNTPGKIAETLLTFDSKEDKNSLSATDKEIEAEFQRLALGFKCDMFTLEKRVRLEERSRDLAEENVRREVSSCQGLLQALTPLCEDDNQSMEIIQRLQKNLDILIQSMTRVSSRSEMLGAIHQESRIGRAVEVMIQHVENLRRLYTTEHAELLELRETLMQNERSFGSHSDSNEFRGKKQSASQYYKSSVRRVSIASIPRGAGGNMHLDLSKTEGAESEVERLTRRSPWNMAEKGSARPPLKRFVSSAACVETEEPSVTMKGTASNSIDSQAEDEQKESPVVERRRSSLSELGSKLTSLLLPPKTSRDELLVMLPSSSSSPTSTEPGIIRSLSQSLLTSRVVEAVVARGSRGPWLWVAILVVLAGLLALLASLVMQPAVDAAPVGTGDSWMTIQQLLWPYTGLRHTGQPPV